MTRLASILASIGRVLLPALLLAATYVMLADFVNLGRSNRLDTAVMPEALPLPQPWGGLAWRELSRQAVRDSSSDPELARRMLERRVRNYPIDPRPWLDLARLASQRDAAGSGADVTTLLSKALATRPLDRDSLWSAAQIALQTGNSALAEHQLRSWLREFPVDTGRALFIAARWIASPGALLDRILPPGREYLAEAMSVARRQQDRNLADAVWERLSPIPDLDDPVFLDYIELLLNQGDAGRAAELWALHDESLQRLGVTNGSFDAPLGASLGLNWRTRTAPASVRIQRDTGEYATPPASLAIAFNGKENVAMSAPVVRLPVVPGHHYRLSGAWRALGLTTRSLPYLMLIDGKGAPLARQDLPGSAFAWQDWELAFDVPEHTAVVEFMVRRDRTEAFDRNIGGRLWLDDLQLRPADPPSPPPSIPDLLRGASGG